MQTLVKVMKFYLEDIDHQAEIDYLTGWIELNNSPPTCGCCPFLESTPKPGIGKCTKKEGKEKKETDQRCKEYDTYIPF